MTDSKDLPTAFALTEDEKLAQRTYNTIETLAMERARQANEDLQQTAALTRILRDQLQSQIAKRVGIDARDTEAYDVDEDGMCVHREKVAQAKEQAKAARIAVMGSHRADGTVSTPPEAPVVP